MQRNKEPSNCYSEIYNSTSKLFCLWIGFCFGVIGHGCIHLQASTMRLWQCVCLYCLCCLDKHTSNDWLPEDWDINEALYRIIQKIFVHLWISMLSAYITHYSRDFSSELVIFSTSQITCKGLENAQMTHGIYSATTDIVSHTFLKTSVDSYLWHWCCLWFFFVRIHQFWREIYLYVW